MSVRRVIALVSLLTSLFIVGGMLVLPTAVPETVPVADAAIAANRTVGMTLSVNGVLVPVDPDDNTNPNYSKYYRPGGQLLNACPGSIIDIKLTVNENVIKNAGEIKVNWQPSGNRMNYLGEFGASNPPGIAPTQPANSTDRPITVPFTVADLQAAGPMAITLRFKQNSGHNNVSANITGQGGIGTHVEFDCYVTPTATPIANTPTPVPTVTPTVTPTPAVCPNGSLDKSIYAIAQAGSGTFYNPADLKGPGNFPAGSRVTRQLPGGNIVITVQPGEVVYNLLDIQNVSSVAHPKLVVTDRYQMSYQNLLGVVAANGQAATYLGSGNVLPNPLPNTFSFFDKNGEVFIFNVPPSGGGFNDLHLVTQIKPNITSGYITNQARIAGKIVGNQIVAIPGQCGDSAETRVGTGYSGTIGAPAPRVVLPYGVD